MSTKPDREHVLRVLREAREPLTVAVLAEQLGCTTNETALSLFILIRRGEAHIASQSSNKKHRWRTYSPTPLEVRACR